ncbi:MAG: hypothetical protein ABI421_21880 [Polyangiaceae bacterium]
MIASAILHGATALLVLHVHTMADPAPDPIEIDLVDAPPLRVPQDLDLGISGAENEAIPVHAEVAHVTRAALAVAKESAIVALSGDGDSPKSAELGPGWTNDARICEDQDCVLEALNRCLAGDGDGCVEVGQYYEIRRSDPFSAIKWYVKGCGLESHAGCDANDRVHGVMPLGWAHRRMLSPT